MEQLQCWVADLTLPLSSTWHPGPPLAQHSSPYGPWAAPQGAFSFLLCFLKCLRCDLWAWAALSGFLPSYLAPPGEEKGDAASRVMGWAAGEAGRLLSGKMSTVD